MAYSSWTANLYINYTLNDVDMQDGPYSARGIGAEIRDIKHSGATRIRVVAGKDENRKTRPAKVYYYHGAATSGSSATAKAYGDWSCDWSEYGCM